MRLPGFSTFPRLKWWTATLPSHLAPPRFEKWHSVSVLPRARGVLETLLRKLAPAVLKKMVRSAGLAPASPDWHSGILLLNDERE